MLLKGKTKTQKKIDEPEADPEVQDLSRGLKSSLSFLKNRVSTLEIPKKKEKKVKKKKSHDDADKRIEELQTEINKANKRIVELDPQVEEKLNPKGEVVIPNDMRECLVNEDLSFVFWIYLREQYVHENFSFWLSIEDYKSIQEEKDRQKFAHDIFKKYFKPGSEYELSIGDDLKKAIDSEISSGAKPETFNIIQSAAWYALATEHFPKFLQSETFSLYTQGKRSNIILKKRQLRKSLTFKRLGFIQKNHPEAFMKFHFQPTSTETSTKPHKDYGVAFGLKRGGCESCSCLAYDPEMQDSVCECGHWPAKHKNLGRVPIRIESIMDDKERIMQKLIEPGLKLVSALCDLADYEKSEEISRAIVYLFDYYGRSLYLLKFALERETRDADRTTLFREDKMSFRILSNYVKIMSRDWLRKTLGPVISGIMSKTSSYEINPSRLIGSKEKKSRKSNIKRLRKLGEEVIAAIFKSIDKVPSKLRLLCSLVMKKVKKAFPGNEIVGLGALLFLRFICPALCVPKELGLVDSDPLPEAQRGLILVAKLLQNLSLNIRFGDKESFMYDMDDFIETNYPSMDKFLNAMGTPSSSNSADIRITKQQKDDAKATVYDEIKITKKILELEI